MRWLLAPLALLFLMTLPARAGHSPPLVMMRVFVQSPGEGLPESESHDVQIPPDNETITIRALPEFTEANLTDVQVDAAGNTHFHLDHTGSINLDAVTAENQGRILVVTIDGYVIYAPIIDEEISNGDLVVPHPIPPQIIQLLQKTAQENVRKAARP